MDELYFIESLTNDRLRDEVGDITLVPAEDRIIGPGSSPVMAAFTHISPDCSNRFSDGSYGIYYAAKTLATAIEESKHHRANFLAYTHELMGGCLSLGQRSWGRMHRRPAATGNQYSTPRAAFIICLGR